MSTLMTLAATPPVERRRHTGRLALTKGNEMRVRDVAANLAQMTGYSAHADQRDLVDWMFYQHADKEVMSAPVVFIQHGEDRQRAGLAEALQERASACSQSLTIVQPTPCNSVVWHSLEA